jgi:predicted phage terminase large subunit-like protein
MLPEEAPFTSDFLAECEAFTADDSHMHDDQVDPMMDAINDLLASNNAASLWEKMI